MNTRVDLERSVGAWLRAAAGDASPDYLDEIVDRVANVGQRPWWSSPRGWLPMNSPVPRTFGFRPNSTSDRPRRPPDRRGVDRRRDRGRSTIPARADRTRPVWTACAIIDGGRAEPPVIDRALLWRRLDYLRPPRANPRLPGVLVRSRLDGPQPHVRGDGDASPRRPSARRRRRSRRQFRSLLEGGRPVRPGDRSIGADGQHAVPAARPFRDAPADGRVLVAGGWNYGGPPPASEELYDPSTGRWTATGAMVLSSRHGPSAVILADGRVLLLADAARRITAPGARALRSGNRQLAFDACLTAAPAESLTRLADGRRFRGSLEGREAPEVFRPGLRTLDQRCHSRLWLEARATLLRNGEVPLESGELLRPGSRQLAPPAADSRRPVAAPRPSWGTGPSCSVARPDRLGTIRDRARGHQSRVRPFRWITPWPAPGASRSTRSSPWPDRRALATEGGSAALFDPAASPG